MTVQRPYVFIGSSAEGHHVATAIQQNLQYCAEPEVWSQGGFGLMGGTLDSLVKKLDEIDFAVLVLTADDLVDSRGELKPAPRDNVLLELGLFIGGLGRERTYMVCDRSVKLKLPSDLAGVTPATFEPPTLSTWQAAVGPASTEIANTIKKIGRRDDLGLRVTIQGGTFTGINGYGLSFTITNSGTKPIPQYQIALFHPGFGWLYMFSSQQSGELLPHQERSHEIALLSGGKPLDHLPKFENDVIDDVAFRLVLENSSKVLYENKKIGAGVAKAIMKIVKTRSMGLTWDEVAAMCSE